MTQGKENDRGMRVIVGPMTNSLFSRKTSEANRQRRRKFVHRLSFAEKIEDEQID